MEGDCRSGGLWEPPIVRGGLSRSLVARLYSPMELKSSRMLGLDSLNSDLFSGYLSNHYHSFLRTVVLNTLERFLFISSNGGVRIAFHSGNVARRIAAESMLRALAGHRTAICQGP